MRRPRKGTAVDHEIVAAEGGDVGALVRLSSELFREDAGIRDPYTDVGWPGKHGRDHFLSLISRSDALCLLAKFGRTPVGYLAGYVGGPTTIRPVRVAELQSVYVRARDRDRGVGSALVAEFLSWAWTGRPSASR
ncbi:MAG TPA: GNAT family N-acetyltransferase [Rubrobacter sp.]|nr:GNAT family N-acetyltransferase [Rubrobacter sp.]